MFLEGLDSVRYVDLTRLKPEFKPRLPLRQEDQVSSMQLLAKVQLLLPLLFGQRVLVPYSYAFDSPLFLENAAEAIDARNKLDRKVRRQLETCDLDLYHPFLIGKCYDPSKETEPTFESLLRAAYTREVVDPDAQNISLRAGVEPFVVSAFSSLSMNPLYESHSREQDVRGRRLAFSKEFMTAQPSESRLRDCLDRSDKADQARVDALLLMREYFQLRHVTKAATRQAKLLPRWIANWRGRQRTLAKSGSQKAENIIKALHRFPKTHLLNRSSVRVRIGERCDPETALEIIGTVDRLYNLLLVESNRPGTCDLTTGGDAREWPTMRAGAVGFSQKFVEGEIAMWLDPEHSKEILGGLDWTKYWEIVQTPEWQKSLRELRAKIGPTGSLWLSTGPAERAFENHLKVTSKLVEQKYDLVLQKASTKVEKMRRKLRISIHDDTLANAGAIIGGTVGLSAGWLFEYLNLSLGNSPSMFSLAVPSMAGEAGTLAGKYLGQAVAESGVISPHLFTAGFVQGPVLRGAAELRYSESTDSTDHADSAK